MEGEFNMQEPGLEISCWSAACQALAAVAPRYGIDSDRVREICEISSAPQRGDRNLGIDQQVLVVRRIAAGLIEGMQQEGAEWEELVDIAQDAFEARHRLTLLDLPSQILQWED